MRASPLSHDSCIFSMSLSALMRRRTAAADQHIYLYIRTTQSLHLRSAIFLVLGPNLGLQTTALRLCLPQI